jgi:hypothetical protein
LPAAAGVGRGWSGQWGFSPAAEAEVVGDAVAFEPRDSTPSEAKPRGGTSARGGGRLATSASSAAPEEDEALDVASTAEPDEEEAAAERGAAVLDALLLTTEDTLSTLGSNTLQILTPDAARSWRPLRAFRQRDRARDAKEVRVQTAKEALLDQARAMVSRR